MLFRKKIERACDYCARGTKLNDAEILCKHKGIMPPEGKCCKFTYDPCKRVPSKPKAMDFSQYEKEDYSL